IRYLTQDQPLGTAHAIRCAEQHIDDAFLVIYGDNIFTTGLVHHTKLIHEHTSNDTVATYALHYEPDKEKLKEFGTAEVDDEHHITRIVEKSPTPASSYVVTGIMIFEPIIFDVMKNPANWRKSPRDEYESHDYTNLLIQGGRIVNANISTSSWMDLTRPGDIQRANKMIKEIYS
ncbi:MAG: sugar phosphate nucleotidyltransferase, partial [Nitrososphaerales archaeon]